MDLIARDWRTIPRIRRRIERIAYHEAGHAVGWYAGGYAARVELDFTDADYFWGHTTGMAWLGKTEHWAQAATLAVLAGPSAAARYAGLQRLRLSATDRGLLEEAATMLYPVASERREYLRQRRQDAAALWDAPGNWAAVEAIVTALMDVESLGDGQCKQIIAEATGRELDGPYEQMIRAAAARDGYVWQGTEWVTGG